MPELAFDVKLAAVVRVQAETEEQARAAMEEVLQAMNPSIEFLEGYSDVAEVKVTEASLFEDDADGPTLFEVDGEPCN